MIITASEICRLALLRLRVVARDEAMEPNDASHALTVFNLMMHGFAARGADMGYSSLDAEDPVGVPESLYDGLVHLLAIRLAPDFAVATPTSDGFDFLEWWTAFLRRYGGDYEPSTFDGALLNTAVRRL